jgi:hypothetical protein
VEKQVGQAQAQMARRQERERVNLYFN